MAFGVHDREIWCQYCGSRITFDDNIVSPKTGKKYPLEYDTLERHHCQEYYDAMRNGAEERGRAKVGGMETRPKPTLEWKQNLRNNEKGSERQPQLERRLLKRGRKIVEEQKSGSSGGIIIIDEEPDGDKLVIERRPSDPRED